MEGARLVGALVGVGTEQVTLRLDEVRRQAVATNHVVVRQRTRRREERHPRRSAERHDASPGGIARADLFDEAGVKEEVRQVGIAIERGLDAAQELRADDAAPRQILAISPNGRFQPRVREATDRSCMPWA